MGEFEVLGKSLVRKDAVQKVKGEATFISDIQSTKMLYAKFLRSPHAHAWIKTIDVSKAEAIPGVKCILTFKNVPKVHPMRKLEFLLDETVHHPGEEVAAIAALTPEIAEQALQLIDVNYELLPGVFSTEEALKPEAPLARHEYGANVFRLKSSRMDKDGWLNVEFGNVEEGLAEADYILEGSYETPIQYNCSPLPRSVVCQWEGDKLMCWADTQLPLVLWQDLASNLGIPQSSVRLSANYAVGGYGGKSPEKTATLVAIMARRTGRPVKAVYSRTEDIIGTHHRINYSNHNKIGVKKDGTITALHSKIIANWGSDTAVPYACQNTALAGACTMLYKCQNTRAETIGVLTNFLGYGPMNGFGDPEAIYAIERLIDEASEKINMDPVKFRLKNCMRYGDKALEFENVTTGPLKWGVLGHDMDAFPEIIEKCSQAANWQGKWKGWKEPVAIKGPKRSGIGIAIGTHHTSFWPSSAIVKFNQDGSANVLSGAVEMGQGYGTALAQVVAETLGIGYEDVDVTLADTAATPATRGNVASTGTSSPMRAAQLAAEDARHKLFELAAPRLNAAPDQLEARDRSIWVKGTDARVPIADICRAAWQVTGTANTPHYESIKDEKTGKVIHAFAASATIAEVEVDTETGKVDILGITSGHECGRAINPVIIQNQIDLGLVMASGWLLSEEYIVDSNSGVIVNPNLLDYKILTILDIPHADDWHRVVAEKPCAWGPFGAKGFSETAMCALGPAIVNAIYNATGVRIYAGFISPAVVLKALNKAGK